MNPLDTPGNPFGFEARNITARAASSKEGPKYKIGLEVDKATFDAVITANVEGAVFAFVCNRVDLDAMDAPLVAESAVSTAKPPTGPRCREAVGLMKEKDFADFVYRFFDNIGYTPKEYVEIICRIKSRREFDEGPGADEKYARFCEIKRDYRKWQEKRQ